MKDSNQRREFVGNAVYPMIQQAIQDPQMVGKVTGMIIDESVVDVNSLLTDPKYLSSKVTEAFKLLQSQAQQPPQQPSQETPQSQ